MTRRIPIFQFRRSIFAAGLCVALGACENPFAEDAPTLDDVLAQGRLIGEELDKVLTKGWLFRTKEDEANLQPSQPVYCYQTIGVGDCFDQPLEDGGNRLVGFEGPAPLTDIPAAKP